MIRQERAGRRMVVLSLVASGLGLVYALYRGYYALGGRVGMQGVPASYSQWTFINGFAAVAILIAAAVPIVALPFWGHRVVRPVLLVLFSIAAVGLTMHGVIDETQRILHLTGLAGRFHMQLHLAGWRSIDMRTADLQDIFWNEPWFLALGLVCGGVVWTALIERRRARRWWLAGALAATAVCIAFGLLAAAGVVGRVVVF